MRADRVPRMRSTEASFPENARLAIISTSDAANLPSTCTISVPFTFAMDGLRNVLVGLTPRNPGPYNRMCPYKEAACSNQLAYLNSW
jgi:hypothetical protein